MSKPTHTDFWVVLHTRTEHDDLDRLETRAATAADQAEAFDLLCEMACLTETQRSEHRLFLPGTDILQLCTILKELTGDEFDAMIYEEFCSRRTAKQLPASLRPESLVERAKPPHGFKARRTQRRPNIDVPYGKVVPHDPSRENEPVNWAQESVRPRVEPMNWAQEFVRPRLKTLFSFRASRSDGSLTPNTEPDEHDLRVRRLYEELKKDREP